MLESFRRLEQVEPMVREYVGSLSSPIDSFLEEHILQSEVSVLRVEEQEAGYYAVYGGKLLTQFYVRRAYRRQAEALFSRVLENTGVDAMFVPTSDELFLSMALDREWTVRKQAYFFQDSLAVMEPDGALADGEFREAREEEIPELVELSGDFIDRHGERIAAGELFVYRRGGRLLGIGVKEDSILQPGVASIGMFVGEAYRRAGVGRDIILRLKAHCYGIGVTPICGCGYSNRASKRTLESAGMVSATRLLRLESGAGQERS
ncbi:GNAT family N-acetyltransferase [Gorillibacterium sp. sgz5001074]|uniref:GNAT family N-acetyltransferase n=1 Tax=Gorillibacterium sp. sgz5001074 TaxID=3446695 RepID=UPI003F672210